MNADASAKRRVWIDRITRTVMVSGVVMLLQPWWRDGFRWGFFAAAVGTLLHIVTSHWQLGEDA